MAKLGEICAFQSGGTPSKNKPEYFGGEIPWISTTALNGGKINETDAVAWITPKAIRESAAKIVPANSIMVGTRVGIGKVAINTAEMSTSQDVISLIDIDEDKWYKPYLCKLLLSKKDYFNSQARGATIKGIKIDVVANIDVPEIDYATQRKVAATLNQIDTLIVLRKQQLEKLDELVKARFVEMFGDPVTNPKGYEKYKLENLARKISDGVHLKPDYTETGRPFLSVVNINKGVINFENCKYVSEDAYQKMIKSTHPERGDVLYTKVGATYGIPAYVDTDIAFCLYVSVCLIKPKREAINPRFLSLSMEMPYVKHQADRRIKGIGVPDLHLNQISEFEILCPPLKEQDIFIYFVERLDEEKRVVQQSLEKLELMKKALMQEYFG